MAGGLIKLPFAYKGIDNQTYQIIGRNRFVLQTKTPDGRIWFLTRKDTEQLLTFLQLKLEDIPETRVE